MGDADITIVAIALILVLTYGTFLFMYSNEGIVTVNTGDPLNSSQYDTPDSGNFFTQLDQVKQTNVSNPEIFFINSILFGTIAFLLVFVGLRYLRGI